VVLERNDHGRMRGSGGQRILLRMPPSPILTILTSAHYNG
jgi:hypothetical protein